MENIPPHEEDQPPLDAIKRSNEETAKMLHENEEKENREKMQALRDRGAPIVGALVDLQESREVLLKNIEEKKIDPHDILMKDAMNCIFPSESAESLWKPFIDLDELLKQQGDFAPEVDVLEKSLDTAESAYVKIKEAIENIQGVVNQFPILKEEALKEKDVESE